MHIGMRKALLGASVATLAMALSTQASAQQRRFDIPAQDAASAVTAFGLQADLQISAPTGQLRGVKTPAVQGEMDARAALGILLAGTGLVVAQDDGRTIVLQMSPQGGSAAGGGAEVEALIVTAQKREEDIQDVPIAISAFSQETLERSQIAGGPDLITQVPNMTFTKTNFTSYSIQLRGIGTQAISATTDPGVAVAFNNTPFIRNRFFEQEFYDLQRVEVLRGPQGTLYGRNATAGVVNIISQKPKFVAEAKLSGDVANFNSTRLEGMVNIPLVEDMVALRLAGAWTKREGYATNEISGNPIDGRDLWSTRLSLRFAPTDAVDVNLVWEHFEENDDRIRSGKQLCKKHTVTQVGSFEVAPLDFMPDGGQVAGFPTQSTFSQGCIRESLYSPDSFQTPNGLSVPYYTPLGAIGLPRAFLDPYLSGVQSQDLRVIESVVDPKYKSKSDLGEMQVSWDISDNLTLSSETAYNADFVWSTQDFNRFNTAPGAWEVGEGSIAANVLDEDGVFCDPQVGCSDRLVAIDLSTGRSRQFSQEFRLGSDFSGPFNFSLGANFLRFDGEDKYYVFINSLTLSRLQFQGSYGTDPGGAGLIYQPGISDNSECSANGLMEGDSAAGASYTCVYVEQNSIENIQDQGHNYFLSKNPYRLISYAVFGEAYYNITDNLKLTGGLRWTVDKKHAPRIPSWTLAGDGTHGYPVLEVIDQEWREPTGRLTLDWKPDLGFTDETLLYASYAHGYKAGGANPPPMTLISTARFGGTPASVTRPKTFDPEFIDAFELGAKNILLDGKVTLNLAAFYYDYKDYQISEIVDRSAFNRNFDATIWGLEIEADWRPLENLKFGFKGGYENTAIADGERAIDLMDRTAGTEGWVIVRPFPTSASSCVAPDYIYTYRGSLRGVGGTSGGGPGVCELAYLAGVDPVTGEAFDPDNPGGGIPNYLGFDPFDESVFKHNFGEGFLKDIGGNPLPNAPEFTATITADYTLPLPNEWLATLHTDLYWQSGSNWRVFDDHEYNKLDEYFTMNLAAIFTNEDAGWKVMAYVKNVFDRDSITGAFLNSDDTGLTTNVFLTEPRLYGLRVTKEWTGGPLWGSFGSRHEGPYPFEVEIGGQLQRHDAPNDALTPSFMGEFSDALNPLSDQQDDLDWGDGREVKVAYRPNDTWNISLGARFGKTNGSMPWNERTELADTICPVHVFACQPGGFYGNYAAPINRYNYSGSTTYDREEHSIVDFMVGRDVSFGLFDGVFASTISAGVQYADLSSTTSAHIFGQTNWDTPDASKYPDPDTFVRFGPEGTHDHFDGAYRADREFKGAGPKLKWEVSAPLMGHKDVGILAADLALSGGLLFGQRDTSIEGEEVREFFSDFDGQNPGGGAPSVLVPEFTTVLPRIDIHRSEDVTVPVLGASLGLSYKVDRFAIGAGYRWERFHDAIDAGFPEAREEDRTIDGPYFKVSVGFGG